MEPGEVRRIQLPSGRIVEVVAAGADPEPPDEPIVEPKPESFVAWLRSVAEGDEDFDVLNAIWDHLYAKVPPYAVAQYDDDANPGDELWTDLC